MSSSVPPLRLVLLAERPEWTARLRASLAALENPPPLFVETEWRAAGARLEGCGNGVLLTTPDLLPGPGPVLWPTVLLLEQEPRQAPEQVVDWLVASLFSTDMLRRCLRYLGERNQWQHALQRLATQDPLTGIANRQGFQALLAARLLGYPGRSLVLGQLDLDSFRHVNDALGHGVGDRLIVQVVARLKAELEAGDALARLGGDEFALLLDTRRDPGRAAKVADCIVEALAEPYCVEGESLMIGCSLGLVQATPESTPDPLMWQAGIAMQQAKAAHGCTWYWYDPHVDHNARQLASLEGELRRALRRDELELHYQPRLCLGSGRIVGLEALVRWPHAERGLLSPSEFIPIAEESGLIVPMGYWIIARALRDLQGLRESGIEALHMAVNLSFRQFQDSQLLPTLKRLIGEREIDPHWLEFELTETAVMRRSVQVRQTMEALGQLGVRFSLDDFGTGFSSFVHLNNLPISLLKIDKSFVAASIDKPKSRQLLQAMIGLAHNLQLEVVAEGVESEEQLSLLRRFGANQVQGYLISKPLVLEELLAFMDGSAGHHRQTPGGG